MGYRADMIFERTFPQIRTGNYFEYRIPGIVVTQPGTLLCCCEGRMDTNDDWAKIDTLICRSGDDGETWEITPIVVPEAMGGTEGDTTNNPTLIVDGNVVHLIFHQNYARAFHIQSEDDGRTWSAPVEITDTFRAFPKSWNCCATGPGHGVCMKNGRLVAPVWIAMGEVLDAKRIRHQPSWAGAIYSDDHGKTWHAGALTEGILDANETAVVSLADGSLLFNFRNCEPDCHRRLAVSGDGGESFGAAWIAQDLPDPMCFGSMAVLPDGSVAFANCSHGGNIERDGKSARRRINMTVSTSGDGGKSWRRLAYVDELGGYPDIAVHGNFLYILYEITEDSVISRVVLKKYALLEE